MFIHTLHFMVIQYVAKKAEMVIEEIIVPFMLQEKEPGKK